MDDVRRRVELDGRELEVVVGDAAETTPQAAGTDVLVLTPTALRSPMTIGRDARDTARLRWRLRDSAPALADVVAEIGPDALRAEALGLARARAEAFEDGADVDGAHDVVELCGLLWTAAHGEVAPGAEAHAWAAGLLDVPDADAGHAALRAFAWEVVRLTGTWALERR